MEPEHVSKHVRMRQTASCSSWSSRAFFLASSAKRESLQLEGVRHLSCHRPPTYSKRLLRQSVTIFCNSWAHSARPGLPSL